MDEPEVQVVPDPTQLAARGAEHVVIAARTAIAARGVFRWCVSGGQTPRGVYARLAGPELAPALDWQHIQIYFGDERCVPPADAQSNYRMLRETLLAQVPIPEANVHRIAGELDPSSAASEYAQTLRTALSANADGSPKAAFDLVLLGLGADAHTASLFPGSDQEADPGVWASARRQPSTGQWRVTLTEPALNAAQEALFLVSGEDKAQPLARVLRGPRDMARLPAQRIAPRGTLTVLVDQAAAARLGS